MKLLVEVGIGSNARHGGTPHKVRTSEIQFALPNLKVSYFSTCRIFKLGIVSNVIFGTHSY